MLLGLNMGKPLVTGKMRLSVISFLGEDARNAVAFGDWFCECGVLTHTNLSIGGPTAQKKNDFWFIKAGFRSSLYT